MSRVGLSIPLRRKELFRHVVRRRRHRDRFGAVWASSKHVVVSGKFCKALYFCELIQLFVLFVGGVIELERRNSDCFSWRTCRRKCHVKLIEPNDFQSVKQSWCELANVRTFCSYSYVRKLQVFVFIQNIQICIKIYLPFLHPKSTTSNRPTDVA